jgi:hypothetical protein
VIHDTFETAVQPQFDELAVTRTVFSPPLAPTDCAVGDADNSQAGGVGVGGAGGGGVGDAGAAAWLTVTIAPATVRVPLRAAPGFDVTT